MPPPKEIDLKFECGHTTRLLNNLHNSDHSKCFVCHPELADAVQPGRCAACEVAIAMGKELTTEQTEMLGNIYDRACDFPDKTFEQVARETLNDAGYAAMLQNPLFEAECRQSFNLARK